MAYKKQMKDVGAWAFLIGVFGALIVGALVGLGLFEIGGLVSVVLVLAGIIIGLVRVSKDKAVPIMVIALVLGLGGAMFTLLPVIGEVVNSMLSALAMVMIPAGITVAVKLLLDMR